MAVRQQDLLIQQVWEKGAVVPGYDRNVYRKDTCGAWIKRFEYGNRNSGLGWEIDHIDPRGPDQLSNYQPLHWGNNAAKSDGRLVCVITSNDNKNVRRR